MLQIIIDAKQKLSTQNKHGYFPKLSARREFKYYFDLNVKPFISIYHGDNMQNVDAYISLTRVNMSYTFVYNFIKN